MAVIYTPKEKKKIIVRVILFIAVLLIAAGLIVFLFIHFRTKEGFETIDADYSEIDNVSSSYQLYYYVDDASGSISKTRGNVEYLYSESLDKAYMLIDSVNKYDGVTNIKTINENPNTDLTVDTLLYNLLKEIYDFNPDYLYLGGVYDVWKGILFEDNSLRLADDPVYNEETSDYLTGYLANYAGNISLEFKDNNVICLNVSDEFKNSYSDTSFLGINLFEEAFVLDYISASFKDAGFNQGYMVSENGFVVNFGMKDKASAVFRMLNESEIVATLNINKSCYIAYQGFNYTGQQQFYSFDKEDITYRRSRLINPSTGYSDYDSKSLVTFGKDTLVNQLIAIYQYYSGNKDISYIDLKYSGKIYTNVSEFKNDSYEVIYE